MCSSASKTTLFYVASIPRCSRNKVACFTSASNKLQGGINASGNLREGAAGSYDNKTRLGRRGEEGGAAEDTAELARAGAAATVETELKVGEMTKQTVDAVKETAENVRDTVAAAGDENEQPNREEAVKDLKQQPDN